MDASKIMRFKWDIMDSNSWLIVENDKGLLFDPVDSDDLFSAISSLNELVIVLTHCHFDHISGLNRIRKMHINTCVIATSECSNRIRNPQTNLSKIANSLLAFSKNSDKDEAAVSPFSCDAVDCIFDKKLDIFWNDHTLNLSEYNGHSKGSLCCVIDDVALITGDTLMPSPTVTRLPGGDTKRFWVEDIPRLKSLAGIIQRVYPGHGEQGDLEKMIRINEDERDKSDDRKKSITKITKNNCCEMKGTAI